MPLHLFELDEHPDRIAASKKDTFVNGGVFFLDFTRPLESVKKFGIQVVAVFAPVVHQGEEEGGYVIGVHRSDPQFKNVRALWKANYPAPKIVPTTQADGLQIIADFANQFPEDCQ